MELSNSKRKEVVTKLRNCVNCLRLELPEEIANEVKRVVEETINWYDQQLEISYAYDMESHLIEIPDDQRNSLPSGIECRDETIRLIENSNEDLILKNHILLEALKFYARPDVYGVNGGSSDYIIQDAGKTAKKALKLQKEVYRGRK